MEIKSEQKYTEAQVIDLDIAFPGELQTYTLREGQDTLTFNKAFNTFTLTFAAGGEMVFYMQHAHWYAKRHRTIRVPVPE